jgi:hypothetical protein
MLHRSTRAALLLVFLSGLSVPGLAQVTLKDAAVVYFGCASNATAPATLDEAKVREATPEWQTIKNEDVKKGTARYKILVADMDKRIREAVKSVATKDGRDVVVRSGDIDDAKGKTVTDITDAVVAKLGQNLLAAAAAAG